MISKIHLLKQKILFATKQANAWRLRRAHETDSKRLETINLIISMIEDDKSDLKEQIQKATN